MTILILKVLDIAPKVFDLLASFIGLLIQIIELAKVLYPLLS